MHISNVNHSRVPTMIWRFLFVRLWYPIKFDVWFVEISFNFGCFPLNSIHSFIPTQTLFFPFDFFNSLLFALFFLFICSRRLRYEYVWVYVMWFKFYFYLQQSQSYQFEAKWYILDKKFIDFHKIWIEAFFSLVFFNSHSIYIHGNK